MNKRFVLNVTGRIIESLSLMLLAPFAVSLLYRESCYLSFLITAIIAFVLGKGICLLTREHDKTIFAKEGFAIVTLAWVTLSLIGALPFYISGEIPSYIDAVFETVSGFTTTGSSILRDVTVLSKGILFWRSFTHWIGGMGILVFVVAFLSNISDRSIHILKAEMPGPIVGKITPRSRDTSKVLYLIYIVLTLIEIIFLWCGDMDLFESVVHALGTAGTGGFGVKADSIASYSAYSQWVITAFMIIFGINFNLFYLVVLGKIKTALKSEELRAYCVIVIGAILLISGNIYSVYGTFSETVRQASFQTASIISTTGYASTDFNLWPTFSKAILVLLMFSGACAGSTAGGLKVSRVMLVFKMIAQRIKKMVHPRSVSTIKIEDKEVDETTQGNTMAYMCVYFFLFLIIFLILSLNAFDFETTMTAAITCFNNVGPGFALVGPMGGFADFSVLSKITLCIAMLLGRLEIFPILITLIPANWKKQ